MAAVQETPVGRAALVLLCTAQFVDVLDVNVVLVALPAIANDLGLGETALQWVISAYVLPFAGCLLLAGRLADVFGRRRLFMAGLALFTAASLLCGLAASAGALLAGRALQGLGAALTAPAALAIITTSTRPGAERDRAIATWTAVAAAGGAAGLVLGGVITDSVGWPWVFLVNVPVGIAALVLAPRVLPESRDGGAPRHLDVGGAVTVTGGLVAVVLGLTELERSGPGPVPLAALGVGIALLAALPRIERRVRTPLVPPGALRDRRLMCAGVVGGTLTAVTGSAAVITTLFLQEVRGLSASAAGLAAVPLSLAVVAGSVAGGRLLDRAGARRTAIAGLALVAVAGLVASRISPSAGAGHVVAWGVLAGAGLGAASVAATRAGTAALPPDQRGLASGMLNTAAQAGTALGLAVLLSIAAARTAAGGQRSAEAVVDGYQLALLAGAALATAAMLAASSLGRPGDARRV